MKLSIKSEWKIVKEKLIKIDSKLKTETTPIPTRQMCELLIAGEDHRFRFHPGVDIIGLMRSIWKTIIYRNRQGGSTIAMQLVRTLTGRYEKTFLRKIREIILALMATKHFGKNSLPMCYLYVGYYGWRMNNFKQACIKLSIEPELVDEFEAAKLIARLKYPEPGKYSSDRFYKIERRARHLISIKNNKNIIGIYGTFQNYGAASRSN